MIEKAILQHLSDHGESSISEIAATAMTSVPTVTKYLSGLENKGLILSCGRTDSGQGRKACLYKICETKAYFVGVDPKQNSLEMALCDFAGTIVRTYKAPLAFENTPEGMEEVCSRVEEFISGSKIPADKIKVIAFNLSGRVNPKTGYSYSLFNFENQDEPLSAILSSRLGCKVIIENDTRSMAYGEMKSVVKNKYSDFLYINVGWGIGLSIIIDGKQYYGRSGYSGEFGHSSTYDNEIMCHCGKKGCLETEVSGRAILHKFLERVSNGETTILKDRISKGQKITYKDIIHAANHDDMLAIDVLEKAGSELGKHIANLINIFNPEAVIIGGTIGHSGEFFFQPLQLSIKRYSLRLMSQGMDIVLSGLGEKAGITGACLLARNDYLSSI